MNIETFLVSLFGGGILGALINWARAERAENKSRKIEFLDRQIRKLYGPLYYFVLQADKLFELNRRFHKAYDEEFSKDYAPDEITQKILSERIDKTLGIANKYISYVERNNNSIKKILDDNYSLIDPGDIEVFQLFYEHYVRLNTERNLATGKLETPLGIYKKIGDISFLRPEIIRKVKYKFLVKRKELNKLLGKK